METGAVGLIQSLAQGGHKFFFMPVKYGLKIQIFDSIGCKGKQEKIKRKSII
jgi:hypothetical protein